MLFSIDCVIYFAYIHRFYQIWVNNVYHTDNTRYIALSLNTLV